MINARQELERILDKIPDGALILLCASIQYGPDYVEDEQQHFNLKEGYLQADWDAFLDSLDFKYDNGYGGQQLYGTVWFDNGMWLSRGEYDGSEWWELHKYPTIPDNLKAI